MRTKDVIAIVCSDLHISHKAPLARSVPGINWYDVQADYFKQLRTLAKDHNVPVICAGDVFDKASPPPETINFALQQLPDGMYAIPGQHDLPFHSYADIGKSAFYTLVMADKINLLEPGELERINNFVAVGYPWECEITAPKQIEPYRIHLAVIHAYIWKKDCDYMNAPKPAYWSNWMSKLQTFNSAVFGDNHKGFNTPHGSQCQIFNCGTFIRRKSDEMDYRPRVGLLLGDGSFTPHYLDVTNDEFVDPDKAIGDAIDTLQTCGLDEFMEELNELGSKLLDFEDVIKRAINDAKVSQQTREVILRALERKDT